MRLITVRTPTGEGKKVAEIAFEKGIKEVAIGTATLYRADGGSTTNDIVDIETATPIAKRFVETLLAASFFNPLDYSLTIRHPESLFGAKPPNEDIHPIIRPTTDVYEELYQFTKVTFSLAGRVFLSSILISYGMVEDALPLVIAGLLFLPYHHHMIGLALSSVIREWRFFRQAALALLLSTALIF